MKKVGIFVFATILFCLYSATCLQSQVRVTTLYAFPPANGGVGAFPVSPLTEASDGNFYGTTNLGGTGAFCSLSTGCGTVFKITPAGVLTTIYDFCSKPGCADGAFPDFPMALVEGSDGALYGTTSDGGISTMCGSFGCGAIFKITTAGALTSLYSFCLQTGCPDGQFPTQGLVLATDGNLYGMTERGGINNPSSCLNNGSIIGCGTVFRMTAAGDLTTLYMFCSNIGSNGFCLDGFYPEQALIEGSDGNFHGTTTGVGANGNSTGTVGGTVFSMTPSGQLTTIYSFCRLSNCADGSIPFAPLTEGSDGNFYGTTFSGGTGIKSLCLSGCGTLFRMTPAGQLVTLYNFCSLSNCKDGKGPAGSLVQGRNGNLYGITEYGGHSRVGSVYTITPADVLTTLHSFCSAANCADGAGPDAGLTQTTNGTFYGTTSGSGRNKVIATIFRLDRP